MFLLINPAAISKSQRAMERKLCMALTSLCWN